MPDDDPPTMPGWNLALRFGLEVAALTAVAMLAWQKFGGPVRWIAVIVVPLAAATVWAAFNVTDDPSRSGRAPVEVPGWVRFLIEIVLLVSGPIGFALVDQPGIAAVVAVLTIVHLAAALPRIGWLLRQ